MTPGELIAAGIMRMDRDNVTNAIAARIVAEERKSAMGDGELA